MASSSDLPKSSPHSPECTTSYLPRASSLSSGVSTPCGNYETTNQYLSPLIQAIEGELDRRDSSAKSTTPSPSKKRHVTNLPPEEKRQRRLVRNREAAKECRKKKKVYVESMEIQLKELEAENFELKFQLQELQAKLTLGVMRLNITQGKTIPLDSLNFQEH